MRLNERGAIIIHVAIALIALLCFAGIVIDQGVMYVSRAQAQTAADAGALAGALTLETDPSAHANAGIAAKSFVNQNGIWGQAAADANIDVTSPITCPDGTNACIRVDVMRGIIGRDGAGCSGGRRRQAAERFVAAQRVQLRQALEIAADAEAAVAG